MKSLYIYPTTRAIRKQKDIFRENNSLLPTIMSIDEFEKRAILLPDLILVDSLQSVILLRKASEFEDFNNLKISKELIKFFTKSDSILRFFKELTHEYISFEDLIDGDSFTEFEEQIEILERLFENYREVLKEKGLIDKAFIPQEYRVNRGFISKFDRYELFLEGYLNRFELKLIEEIAKTKPFIIHFQTSKFNKKVQSRFLDMGMEEFPDNSFISFDLNSKKIVKIEKNSLQIEAKVFSVEERLTQIPILFESVQKMVNSGISPNDIVVILPDESFKESIKLYDYLNNFNLSMGFDYNKSMNYKRLDSIYQYWSSFSKKSHNNSKDILKKYNIDLEKLKKIPHQKEVSVKEFFKELEFIGLNLNKKIIFDAYTHFNSIFKNEKMSLKHYLFLWLKKIGKLTIDDIRGGKVTAMGALETRGVSFKGVVILDFNDGIVPAIPAKDNFLNSTIRKNANLPTKNDREALQKQIYKRVLEEAEEAVIIYSQSDKKSPASYLYELDLGLGKEIEPNLNLLYNTPSQIVEKQDPIIKDFDATKIIWSATRLKTFLDCRRKYYYLYEKGLRAKESDELNEGRFLHRLLEHLFKNRDSFNSFNDMKRAIYSTLDKLLDSNSAKTEFNKALWRERLIKFVKNQIDHFQEGWRVVEREKQIEGKIKGVKFRGVVDRIDQDSNSTLLLDYKSGSIKEANRVKNIEKLTNFQMNIYYEILKEKYKNLDLAFIEIFNGKKTQIEELESKNSMLSKIIDELKEIKEFKANRCEDTYKCQYCNYTLLCERGDYL